MSTTTTALNTYYVANCDVSACTYECYNNYNSLYYSLPDCVYYDGYNYDYIAYTMGSQCGSTVNSDTTTDTTDTTTDTTDTTDGASYCSDSELSTSYSVWNSYNTAGCDTSACTSYCYNLYSSLYVNLPNCIYSDGNNYCQIALNLATDCYSTMGNTGGYNSGSSLSGFESVRIAAMVALAATAILW